MQIKQLHNSKPTPEDLLLLVLEELRATNAKMIEMELRHSEEISELKTSLKPVINFFTEKKKEVVVVPKKKKLTKDEMIDEEIARRDKVAQLQILQHIKAEKGYQ